MRFFETKWPALLLWPLSLIYNIFTTLRNVGYSYGILEQHRLDIPVISIGNITVGGTGKTPTVIFIAQWLEQRGVKACILSRGYGRKEKATVIVDSHRHIIDQVGDEPLLLAMRLPFTPVIVDSDRVAAGRLAQQQFHPDVLLLDDGLQHRRLYRDLDIVTFRSGSPFGNGFLLPAGPLRESRRRLAAAHLVWGNGSRPVTETFRPGIPLITAHYQPLDLVDSRGVVHALPEPGTRVVAFCGLAHPAGFAQTLRAMGLELGAFIAFPDHHVYTATDLDRLRKLREMEKAEFLITTEKDWVKLGARIAQNVFWRCVRIQIEPHDSVAADDVLTALFKPWLNGNF